MSPRAQSGLWARIREHLQAAEPMTARAIADALDADRSDVRRLLNAYARRGHTRRVIYRDRPHVHWRLLSQRERGGKA